VEIIQSAAKILSKLREQKMLVWEELIPCVNTNQRIINLRPACTHTHTPAAISKATKKESERRKEGNKKIARRGRRRSALSLSLVLSLVNKFHAAEKCVRFLEENSLATDGESGLSICRRPPAESQCYCGVIIKYCLPRMMKNVLHF